MLKFLRSKLKLKKLTYKDPSESHQKSARKFNQKIQPEKDRPKAVSKASPRSF